MLANYISAAMHQATYEVLPDKTFYGSIPAFQGVWANAATLEACRDELQEVLEGWMLLKIASHLPLPEVNGLKLEVGKTA
jgi:predicted RNase H-like HicB family nuclease